jgi:hypothetical protein
VQLILGLYSLMMMARRRNNPGTRNWALDRELRTDVLSIGHGGVSLCNKLHQIHCILLPYRDTNVLWPLLIDLSLASCYQIYFWSQRTILRSLHSINQPSFTHHAAHTVHSVHLADHTITSTLLITLTET